jgi:hypothetical protein
VTPGLISFDIDGTLEFGDPRGCISVELVRQARELGYIIGSCSDRTVLEQRELWQAAGVEVDFAVPKQGLPSLRERFQARTWLHLGDTDVDRRMAGSAGFQFLHSLELEDGAVWLLRHAGMEGTER